MASVEQRLGNSNMILRYPEQVNMARRTILVIKDDGELL